MLDNSEFHKKSWSRWRGERVMGWQRGPPGRGHFSKVLDDMGVWTWKKVRGRVNTSLRWECSPRTSTEARVSRAKRARGEWQERTAEGRQGPGRAWELLGGPQAFSRGLWEATRGLQAGQWHDVLCEEYTRTICIFSNCQNGLRSSRSLLRAETKAYNWWNLTQLTWSCVIKCLPNWMIFASPLSQ